MAVVRRRAGRRLVSTGGLQRGQRVARVRVAVEAERVLQPLSCWWSWHPEQIRTSLKVRALAADEADSAWYVLGRHGPHLIGIDSVVVVGQHDPQPTDVVPLDAGK